MPYDHHATHRHKGKQDLSYCKYALTINEYTRYLYIYIYIICIFIFIFFCIFIFIFFIFVFIFFVYLYFCILYLYFCIFIFIYYQNGINKMVPNIYWWGTAVAQWHAGLQVNRSSNQTCSGICFNINVQLISLEYTRQVQSHVLKYFIISLHRRNCTFWILHLYLYCYDNIGIYKAIGVVGQDSAL